MRCPWCRQLSTPKADKQGISFILNIEKKKMKNFLFLFAAIIFETFATSMLNKSEQFTRLLPTLLSLAGYGLSFYALSFALREIPVGIAYAIWAGLGIVLITLVGVFFFKQTPDIPAIVGLLLIVAGVVVINLFSKMSVH